MAQASCELIGPIIDTGGFFENARASCRADLGEAAEGTRDGRDRKVESLCDGAQGHLDWTFQIVLSYPVR